MVLLSIDASLCTGKSSDDERVAVVLLSIDASLCACAGKSSGNDCYLSSMCASSKKESNLFQKLLEKETEIVRERATTLLRKQSTVEQKYLHIYCEECKDFMIVLEI